jgi:hypothetical protein
LTHFRELNKENREAAARSAVERGVHVVPYGAFGSTLTPTRRS